MEERKSRKSYCAATKLKIVEFAEINGNRAASREFNVGESSVREWRKIKELLKIMKTTKRARRGRGAFWPEIEEDVKEWILELRKVGRKVSTTSIKLKAKSVAEKYEIPNFRGSDRWCNRFMHRNRFSVRAVTSVGQTLPLDWKEKSELFYCYLNDKKKGVNHQAIGNMDEVNMCFDMPGNFTVEQKGTEDVKINTTGAEKCSFTVVLSVTADGGKLPPMVIFKRKTIPKEKFPKGIFVQANEKGWMNGEMFKMWLEEIWRKRPGSFFKSKSILIFDSAPSHLTEASKMEASILSTIAVIPGGLTKVLQPLDISVNKSFKSKVRNEWERWMISGYHTFTKGGKMRKASYSTVCEWIDKAWKSITPDCILNGFRKAKIVGNIVTVDDATSESECDELTDEEEDASRLPDAFLRLLDSFHSESENEDDF